MLGLRGAKPANRTHMKICPKILDYQIGDWSALFPIVHFIQLFYGCHMASYVTRWTTCELLHEQNSPGLHMVFRSEPLKDHM